MGAGTTLRTMNENKFRRNFQAYLNPLCSFSLEIENTVHYLLHYHHFSQYYFDLINSAKSVSDDFESFSDNVKGTLKVKVKVHFYMVTHVLTQIKTS